jgi:hypothetical protein
MDCRWLELAGLLVWLVLLAGAFAKLEIQIEGQAGWAAKLPTWRVEKHWLLDVFWGGRPLTGYHAWAFGFMFLVFHLPLAIVPHFSWWLEARILGSLGVFWIVEDFLWFVLNPAYGLRRFRRETVAWHPRWLLGAPLDYWVFGAVAIILLGGSFRYGGHLVN